MLIRGPLYSFQAGAGIRPRPRRGLFKESPWDTMGAMRESTSLIIQALKAVPPGKVSSYRNIALAAGLPGGTRQVVRVLHSLTEKEGLPWFRIVKADGRIALPPGAGQERQIALLQAEGVAVSASGIVDLARYGV